MKTLKIALLASVAAVGFGSAAMAADLIVMDPMVEEIATGFDWDGPYVNISAYGGIGAAAGVTGTIGVGGTSDSFYYGAELTGAYVWPLNTFALEGDVRLGFLVSDDVLLYGLAGLGTVGGVLPYGILGAGMEFAVTDTMSIRAQYQADIFGPGDVGHFGKIGLSWYF